MFSGKLPTMWEIIGDSLLEFWKERLQPMELSSAAHDVFVLKGECPFCHTKAAFESVGQPFHQNRGKADDVMVGAARCIACNLFILALLGYEITSGSAEWCLAAYYPLGTPDDSVAPEIPDTIKPDFQEALRCFYVDAYNATAEMCRRAIEASCLQLGAPKKAVLEDMIDWLEEKRLITPLLQQVAHKIRLGGNRGAHPEPNADIPTLTGHATDTGAASDAQPAPVSTPEPITVIGKEHAAAIVEFTRHFFHHVYVTPSHLGKYEFSKPKRK
jgi:hypothetical protein